MTFAQYLLQIGNQEVFYMFHRHVGLSINYDSKMVKLLIWHVINDTIEMYAVYMRSWQGGFQDETDSYGRR